MRAIFHSQNLDNDYVLFENALFNVTPPKYKISDKLRVKLKKYHKFTYIIALIEKKVRLKWKKHPHRVLFVGELLSDLLSLSSISLMGFYKSSKILERRIIENFYNHVFYYDHPIEFELLNSGRNEYTAMVDLKKYFTNHPIITPKSSTHPRIRDYNELVFQQYHELCKHVHTKGYRFMDLAKNLADIKPTINIEDYFEELNTHILQIIFLLYHFQVELHYTNTERALISSAFPPSLRQDL